MAESKDEQYTLTIAAVGLHELFDSYMKAGFTREEAFQLVQVVLHTQLHKGK